MPVFKFSEVLNDTVSTLLWADLHSLLDFQRERQLPADLAQVFTTEASGDEVLAQGALIALAGIANLAYTVIVRVDDVDAELLQAGSDLQCQQEGYVLRVTSGLAALFSWWTLQHFSAQTVQALLARHRARGKPLVALPNGWYSVRVLAGWTQQTTGMEPTLELLLTSQARQPAFTADANHLFTIAER